MPNVVGLPKADVYAAMHRAELYFTTTGPGAGGSWRSVAGQSPKAGTLVAWHTQVTLTTSLAPGHALRRVPHLDGLSRARVYAAMRRAQLFFVTHGSGSANATWRRVLHQSPAAGALVRWHSSVALVVTTSRPRTVTKKPSATTTTVKRRRPPVTTTSSPTTTVAAADGSTTTSTPDSTTTYPGETTTTTLTPTTTTTRPEVTTTTVKKKPVRYRIGLATWYSYIPGRCATSYLPNGTRIKVTALATGRSITCVVTDRQGARTGRVADLSETQFAVLAPLWRGVVRVRVSW
jgi:beta-lactam-binding protein with PASTA domain